MNTLRLSASSIEDASGSEGASRSKMRVRGLKARRGKGWKKVSSAPYVTPPVRNINLDREASTSVAEPTTILNINSRTSFPTLSGGRKATPSTETSGSRYVIYLSCLHVIIDSILFLAIVFFPIGGCRVFLSHCGVRAKKLYGMPNFEFRK